MTISRAGLNLIKGFEGLRLKPYQCQAGVWTIGYGHTDKTKATSAAITVDEAEALLRADLAYYETKVSEYVKVPLSQNEFDALVSFTFNVGASAFKSSTMLRLLNTGNRDGAAWQFLVWNKVKLGNILTISSGLTKRRVVEQKLFLTKD